MRRASLRCFFKVIGINILKIKKNIVETIWERFKKNEKNKKIKKINVSLLTFLEKYIILCI